MISSIKLVGKAGHGKSTLLRFLQQAAKAEHGDEVSEIIPEQLNLLQVHRMIGYGITTFFFDEVSDFYAEEVEKSCKYIPQNVRMFFAIQA